MLRVLNGYPDSPPFHVFWSFEPKNPQKWRKKSFWGHPEWFLRVLEHEKSEKTSIQVLFGEGYGQKSSHK